MSVPGASTSLRRDEAERRAELLDVTGYEVELDLAADEATFPSRTTITFTSAGGQTFVDVKPVALRRATLNGTDLDPATLHAGRLPLPTEAGENVLVVDAVMAFRTDGEGLHHHTDPADGRRYVYGMSFMDAAPSVFACFDQPDLKAPYTLTVRAPVDWTVTANAPGTQAEPGLWRFERSAPLATYFVTVVAGPYHHVRVSHDGIRLGLSCRQSIAPHLDADAEELLTVTRQCFDEFHRLFGIRYPFGDYHQAFVPEFNAGAMENPGCVTFRDPLVFTSRVTRGARIQRAVTVAHEMAHQWFGNLVTPRWWDDLWLNESFAEYMGNRVTADVTEYGDTWVHNAHRRRQWGLVADQRPSTHPVAGNGAVDAAGALQDFDGISYSKGSSVLKQLAALVGDDVFLAGAVDHFTRHRFGNATMHDLLGSWERAGAGDLTGFVDGWLRAPGVDELRLDRAAGTLRRVPPAAHPAERTHALRVASAAPGDATWRVDEVVLGGEGASYDVGPDAAVVVDAYEDTWSWSAPDAATLAALPDLLPRTTDPMLRAGIWNALRSGVHAGAVDPADALTVVAAGLPSERDDDGVSIVTGWALGRLRAVVADPDDLEARVRAAADAVVRDAEPGSTVQLAAFGAVVAATADEALLRSWLAGADLPPGVELDEALRWRVLVRLAVRGATDADALDAALADAPSAVARTEHARARASLPTTAAKEWAWARFTGEARVANYEVEAAGLGLWQRGQEHLTEPYVERYLTGLPAAAEVFSGWLLGDVAEAFFPLTARRTDVLERVRRLAAQEELPGAVRRRVGDMADELARRIG
ncbi:aminopeptidase N [Nocardioides sp. ChNu-153]|uniref:aminopeptidase N n=1 Tax=unclassified Nocardioides TaxID=2615069 RepID=UPI002405D7FC|nr:MULTISPECIES: aminopeptidase N [unclassified Nocardioides]MDF9718089.1 aminopeptidase N [Nocardioides sp. ChNu-99]MDN7122258.1 aminopeptidase N [Nocardioides sp. ChNu-153]